jgi:uncharacterized membrane protein
MQQLHPLCTFSASSMRAEATSRLALNWQVFFHATFTHRTQRVYVRAHRANNYRLAFPVLFSIAVITAVR